MITTINEFKNYLKGGIGDNLSIEDIASKHNTTISNIQHELKKGINVELEHTSDKNLAKEIALDHLTEMPNYYTELQKIEEGIDNVYSISKDNKEIAKELVKSYTKAKNKKITGLDLTSEFKKKLKEKDLPNGFDLGIDTDGWFIHTHRARSKSYKSPLDIPIKDIKFIDSTG